MTLVVLNKTDILLYLYRYGSISMDDLALQYDENNGALEDTVHEMHKDGLVKLERVSRRLREINGGQVEELRFISITSGGIRELLGRDQI